MKEFGSLISKLRKEKKISQEELASMIGCTKQTISNYERNTRTPDYETLEAIADALNVPMGFFLTEKERKAKLDQIYKTYNILEMKHPKLSAGLVKASDLPMRRVPILGPVAAGQPIPALREYDDYIDIPDTGGRYDAALRVQGDSMTPHYRPNDLVFVRYCDDVLDGQVAAVAIDDDVVLKKVYHVSGGVTLISENPAYAPMVFSNDDVSNIHIVGLAVGFLRWEH